MAEAPEKHFDPTQNAEQLVSEAYGRWTPQRMDLFIDMYASEGMVVDGDSLLIEAFCNYNLDWPDGCGQMLHVCYLVEQIINDFQIRGGLVNVVFFDCNRCLWVNDPSKLLARECVIRHLRAMLKNPVRLFPSWWDQSWREYLKTESPSFILINDGEQAAQVFKLRALSEDEDDDSNEGVDPDDIEKIKRQVVLLLRGFMVDSIVNRMHVVYTSRLVRKDNSIHGFVVRCSSTRFAPNGVPLDLSSLHGKLQALFGPETSDESCELVTIEEQQYPIAGRYGLDGTSEVPESDAIPELNGEALRVRLGAASVAALLRVESSATYVALAKAYLLHLLALPHVPLRNRSHKLMELEQLEMERSTYFTNFDTFFRAVMKECSLRLGTTAEDREEETVLEQDRKEAATAQFCDAWDFRLMRKIIAILLNNDGDLSGPQFLRDEFERVWKLVAKAAEVEETAFPILTDCSSKPEPHRQLEELDVDLLPVEDEMVLEISKDTYKNEQRISNPSKVLNMIQEKHGWLKRSERWETEDVDKALQADDLFYPLVAKYQLEGKNEKAKRNKDHQKYLQSVKFGAESMEGFLTIQEQRMIVKKGGKDDSDDEDKEKKSAWSGHGKKDTAPNKAQEIAMKNKLKKDAEEKERNVRQWQNFFNRLDVRKECPMSKLEAAIEEIDKTIPSLSEPSIVILARLEKIKLLERLWVEEATDAHSQGQEPRYQFAVELFRAVHDIIKVYFNQANALKDRIKEWHAKNDERERQAAKEKPKGKKDKKDKKAPEPIEPCPEYVPPLDDEQMQVVRKALFVLGFKDNLRLLDKRLAKFEGIEYQKDKKHKMPSVPTTVKVARIIGKDSQLKGRSKSTVRFQFEHMGHLFERPTGEPDERVPFKPDPWQRELLDCVDRRESVLCTAPTSAGKTFISYYCMKGVLMTSNEDVVVYVAPTRALCNQVAQDVYSRFGHKKYPTGGWSVFGVLGGKDFIQPHPPMGGPFRAQVLITVPAVFEAVMLSPRYQSWAKRIKYVVFDEVHSVDHSREGRMWERLLMVTRAPFLALSATVGNTEDFRDWLATTQRIMEERDRVHGHLVQKKYSVKGVYWDHRWNDLQKFTYVPRSKEDRADPSKKTRAHQPAHFGHDCMMPIHPLSTVNIAMLEKLGEFPKDLPLVPSETLQLYDAMVEAFHAMEKALDGRYSDEGTDHRIRVKKLASGEHELSWRKGLLKGKVGKQLADGPKYPKDDGTEVLAVFEVDNGHVWLGRVPDEEELVVTAKVDGKVTVINMEKEVDASITEAVGDPDDATLDPDNYFAKDLSISQSRAREYERDVKKEFMSWVKQGTKDETIREMACFVLDKFGGKLTDSCTKAENMAVGQGQLLDTDEFLKTNFTDLVCALGSQRKLPALIFNSDQAKCEDLAKAIVTELEEAEAEYKNTDTWKSYVKKVTEQANLVEKLKKTQESQKKGKAGRDEEDKDRARAEREGNTIDADELVQGTIPEILPEYSFVKHGIVPQADLDRYFKDMSSKYPKNHILIRALERGIGVHHAGLSAKYRQAVEKLFRQKYLQVVIATHELALGIHSPCKTVVLAGDDVKMSTMQFRQMAGRAGRRGLDYIGNVLFYGVPEMKIVRVMTSGLPMLKGHYPVEPTLTLRMSILHNHTFPKSVDGNRYEVDRPVVRSIGDCLMHPLFHHGKVVSKGTGDLAKGKEVFERIMRLQWRYTFEYLMREGLIRPDGTALYLAGLTTRAMYIHDDVHMSPSNVVFTALLKRGIFQKVCHDYTRRENAFIVANMTKLLAFLFSRTRMGWKSEAHRSMLLNPDVMDDDCPHEVILDPLPSLFKGEVWRVLRHYSQEYLHLFSGFARQAAMVIEQEFGEDTALPVSKVAFTASENTGIFEDIQQESIRYRARSPFVALAGLGDSFHCVEDLLLSLRSGLYLEEDSIPIIDFIDLGRHKSLDDRDRTVRINAAVYDFIQEGHQITEEGYRVREYLQEFNGLSQSDSWDLLMRFITTVDSITTSCERMAPAWSNYGQIFTCCNTECKPENSRFTAANGLYKCHDCDTQGRDTWMCPTCYENAEDCVTLHEDEVTKALRKVKNKHHVFFRHVDDKFVETMAHICGQMEPHYHELRDEKKQKRLKKMQQQEQKPKRPTLAKPVRRGNFRRRRR